MPKINFYLLTQEAETARLQFACRLAEKLLRQGMPVQLYTGSEEEALQLDQLLWSFTPESFVPHRLQGATTPAAACEAVITWGSQVSEGGTLLNLGTAALPPGHAHYSVIAEFILNDAGSRAQGRELWNLYKQQGYELQHHQM